jgi:tRNA (mo5U34)-methyltransferase
MAEAGAKLALGIDPYIKNVVQFLAMKSAVCNSSAYVLPLSFDDLPLDVTPFDSIFSMGLLYHRKSPIEHLQNIRKLLKDGGELILETLVVEGDENTVLFPEASFKTLG